MDQDHQERLLTRIRKVPIFDTLQFHLDELAEGTATVTVPREPRFDGIFESFHGGLLITVADSVGCIALLTQIDPEEPVTTTDMNIRFLAPCRSDVTAKAHVVKLGRTLCLMHVDLFAQDGRQVAVSQVSYMRLNGLKRSGR
jgi:uncharacterized protein (TIGR00369 family)